MRLDRLPDRLAISVVTIGELRAGVLDADDVSVRDRRLAALTRALLLDPIPIDQAIAETWARLLSRSEGSVWRCPWTDPGSPRPR